MGHAGLTRRCARRSAGSMQHCRPLNAPRQLPPYSYPSPPLQCTWYTEEDPNELEPTVPVSACLASMPAGGEAHVGQLGPPMLGS